MRALLLLATGLGFTALLVVLPALHVAAWSGHGTSTVALVFAALPLVALTATVFRSEPWATVGLYPASHLPVLVIEPELTGPLVYSGLGGLLALGAVVALGVLWFSFALSEARSAARRPQKPHAAHEPVPGAVLPWLAALVAGSLIVAMLVPVLGSRAGEEWGAGQLASLGGTAAGLWIAGRWIVGELGDVWFDQRARHRWLASAVIDRRPSRLTLWSSATIAVVAVVLVILVYG